MATTKFNGPINSVDGFLFNGRECTVGATRIVTTEGDGKGTIVVKASVAGLDTVEFGIAQGLKPFIAGGSNMVCVVRTYDDGGQLFGVTTAASFKVTFRQSTDSTQSYGTLGPATIECLLIGAVSN